MVQVRKGMRNRCTTDFAVPGKSSCRGRKKGTQAAMHRLGGEELRKKDRQTAMHRLGGGEQRRGQAIAGSTVWKAGQSAAGWGEGKLEAILSRKDSGYSGRLQGKENKSGKGCRETLQNCRLDCEIT